MPYAIQRNDKLLAREAPTSCLGWVDRPVAGDRGWESVILFRTFRGASLCAAMQGGKAVRVRDPAPRGRCAAAFEWLVGCDGDHGDPAAVMAARSVA